MRITEINLHELLNGLPPLKQQPDQVFIFTGMRYIQL
ncbi:MAG: hypothetical protein ACI9W6_001458 [Motiliproteus sp.]|jgi:hypothetical protein